MTVKELADQLGITKTTVKRYIERCNVKVYRNSSGTIELDEFAVKAITKAFMDKQAERVTERVSQQTHNSVVGDVTVYQAHIKTLEDEIFTLRQLLESERQRAKEALDEADRRCASQLDVKDEQIKNLTVLLNHQQQLHVASLAALPKPNSKKSFFARIFHQKKDSDHIESL